MPIGGTAESSARTGARASRLGPRGAPRDCPPRRAGTAESPVPVESEASAVGAAVATGTSRSVPYASLAVAAQAPERYTRTLAVCVHRQRYGALCRVSACTRAVGAKRNGCSTIGGVRRRAPGVISPPRCVANVSRGNGVERQACDAPHTQSLIRRGVCGSRDGAQRPGATAWRPSVRAMRRSPRWRARRSVRSPRRRRRWCRDWPVSRPDGAEPEPGRREKVQGCCRK